jgi:hypothetical protein
MANFFSENSDRLFHFSQMDIKEIVALLEDDFKQAEKYDTAPENYEDAMDTYKKILEVAGAITADVIAPLSRSVDEEGAQFADGEVTYAKGTQKALDVLKKAQLMGSTLPRQYGGLNMPNSINNIIIEMVSEADASLQNIYGLQDIAVTINKFASEEQKERVLPLFCTGEYTGAMDLTEAEAGSDLGAVQVKAHFDEKDNCWKLNGVKRFITNGCADIHLVLARSEEGTADARGLSMFLYKRDKDMKIRRIEEKLGIHGSPTTELQYNNAKCELIGKRRFGLIRYVMSLMNGARLGISLQALGVAQAAYNKGLKYALERKQFGKKIIEFPAVYDLLTNNLLDIELSRSLIYRTNKLVDELDILEHLLEHDKSLTKEKINEYRARVKSLTRRAALFTPLSKYYTTEMGNKVCYDAVQIHGGTGFMKDFDVERHTRDVRITNIYEGTTQLQVVAAIGGIMTKELDQEFESYRKKAAGHEGEFRDVYEKLAAFEKMFHLAIDKVQEKKEKDFHDYMARTLVDMGLSIFFGYLILDEGKKSQHKAMMARKYAVERLPIFESNYKKVMDGDETTIRNYEDLLQIKI